MSTAISLPRCSQVVADYEQRGYVRVRETELGVVLRHRNGGVSASCNLRSLISSPLKSTISTVISRPCPLKRTTFSPRLTRSTSRA